MRTPQQGLLRDGAHQVKPNAGRRGEHNRPRDQPDQAHAQARDCQHHENDALCMRADHSQACYYGRSCGGDLVRPLDTLELAWGSADRCMCCNMAYTEEQHYCKMPGKEQALLGDACQPRRMPRTYEHSSQRRLIAHLQTTPGVLVFTLLCSDMRPQHPTTLSTLRGQAGGAIATHPPPWHPLSLNAPALSYTPLALTTTPRRCSCSLDG